MTAAMVVFFFSLFGIIMLFALKSREQKTGRALFPHARESADHIALRWKQAMMNSRDQIERLPPLAALFGRSAVREMALVLAALARQGEVQAHKLADVVSYKHRFERRAPRSEFLRRVSERGSAQAGAQHTDKNDGAVAQ